MTPQQHQALDPQAEGPTRIIDPRTNGTYILAPEIDYETIRELLEEEHRQQVIHAVALRNVASRMNDAQCRARLAALVESPPRGHDHREQAEVELAILEIGPHWE